MSLLLSESLVSGFLTLVRFITSSSVLLTLSIRAKSVLSYIIRHTWSTIIKFAAKFSSKFSSFYNNMYAFAVRFHFLISYFLFPIPLFRPTPIPLTGTQTQARVKTEFWHRTANCLRHDV